MKIVKASLLIVLAVIFYSCSSSEPGSYNVKELTLEELIERVNNNSGRLTSLDAEGEVSIDSPEFSNTGSITVSIHKPDSVYTKLEGPFGITVAQILITRGNFVYYNVMDNKVIRGPSSPLNLGAIMRINLDFDEIVNGFSGTYTFKDMSYEDAKVTIDKGDYLLALNNNFEVKKYWIDSKNFYIKKYSTYDQKGQIKYEVEYSDFEFENGIYFPNKINMQRPPEKQQVWLTYYSKKFNTKRLSYRLRVPPSASIITWD